MDTAVSADTPLLTRLWVEHEEHLRLLGYAYFLTWFPVSLGAEAMGWDESTLAYLSATASMVAVFFLLVRSSRRGAYLPPPPEGLTWSVGHVAGGVAAILLALVAVEAVVASVRWALS